MNEQYELNILTKSYIMCSKFFVLWVGVCDCLIVLKICCAAILEF